MLAGDDVRRQGIPFQCFAQIDDQPFHTARSDLRTTGSCGVFYRTTFKDRSLSHGVRFAEFKAIP